jgi:RimJ/RimL family protein N-acetyltransferase
MLITVVATRQESDQIIALQAQNQPAVLSEAVQREQGFVTVHHDPEVLWRMNQTYPSVIAKSGDVLAGYCLMMPQSFRPDIPILDPLFVTVDGLTYRDQPLRDARWFVMGQVCVAYDFRGQGVFDGMYHHLRDVYRDRFDMVITEIAARNTRSLRAHQRVGFEDLLVYTDPNTGEVWHLVVWPF